MREFQYSISRRQSVYGIFFEAKGNKRELPLGFSSEFLGPWSNCLYMSFIKEEHPELKYPALVDCSFFGRLQPKRFEYDECDLAELPWHGGITFYQEKYDPEMQKTIVKAGCDYMHYGDEEWMKEDYGEKLLKEEAPRIAQAFVEMINKKTKGNENGKMELGHTQES